ncbi:MAG: DUF4157 domain-containing protein [Myxococcales bacterium]|nr:DUF4157 domain-containing protein [Myxococcales bacterium]
MSVLDTLQELGGCAGGKLIYYAAKYSAEVANVFKDKNKLNASAKAKFKPLFPHLNLDKVRIRPDCTLPGNWFTSSNDVVAMTFGYTIYCKGKKMQSTNKKLNILMHELVHVDQVRRRDNSEDKFACAYGKGFLAGGSYRKNPMENEAYDFVATNAFPE